MRFGIGLSRLPRLLPNPLADDEALEPIAVARRGYKSRIRFDSQPTNNPAELLARILKQVLVTHQVNELRGSVVPRIC